MAACSSTRSSSKSTMARTPRPPKGDGTGRTDRARSIRDAWMHAGSWQSLHLGPGVSVIVPARPRAGRGGRRASSVVCAGERQVRAWNRPGGGSGGRRRERVRAGVCDRYGATEPATGTVSGRHRRSTYIRGRIEVPTRSRLTSTVTTHHKLILTSIAGRTSPRAVGAVRFIAREVARRRVTFLTVTFRHGPRISLPSPRWLRPRTSPAAVRAIATTTMLPTRAGR